MGWGQGSSGAGCDDDEGSVDQWSSLVEGIHPFAADVVVGRGVSSPVSPVYVSSLGRRVFVGGDCARYCRSSSSFRNRTYPSGTRPLLSSILSAGSQCAELDDTEMR